MRFPDKKAERRWNYTRQEREDFYDLGVSVTLCDEGTIVFTAHWPGKDELWADGCNVTIPPRIWPEILAWLAEVQNA